MRPRTVQAWLPERPPGPNEAPAHCARPGLSHVAVTWRGYPDANSGQCWGPGLSWPRDSFHPAATGVDRRGSVAALLAGLPRESKSQRSLTLHLDYRESWGPRDAPPLQSCGTREFGEGEARPATPTKEVSCFARFSLGH